MKLEAYSSYRISDDPKILNPTESDYIYAPLEIKGTFVFPMNLGKHKSEYTIEDFYCMASDENCSWEVDVPSAYLEEALRVFKKYS